MPGDIDLACTLAERDGGATVGGRMYIHVRDTGAGIAADALERIVEPCVQVDQRLTRPQHGVGIGPATSRDPARDIGGDPTAASDVRVGSTFTLTLPAAT